MSDTEQKETEFVSGAIIGIIQKAADKWQVEVQPDGSQYTKKLWTKDAELVTAVTQKIGSQGAFVCGVSHWTTNEGKPVRSLWINSTDEMIPEKASGSVATPVAVTQARPPVLGGDKDLLIVRQVCIKAAAELNAGAVIENMRGSMNHDPVLAVMTAAARFETWIYRDIDEVPFS